MRFDAPEHLKAWKETGAYPKIHDRIAQVACTEMLGRVLVDLGCSYGLLGHRIAKSVNGKAVGVDADEKVLLEAIAAGIDSQLICLRVKRATISKLCEVIAGQDVDALIARRVLPELWGEDLDGGKEFAGAIADAGVKELFIEGRVKSPGATNALSSIDAEVALMTGPFKESTRVGPVSYMRRV